MKHALRISFSLVLAALVGLASLTHALARHQAHGATTMVICTGYGLVRITLDADGNPVEQSLPCPDCTVTPATLLSDGPVTTAPAQLASVLTLQPEICHWPSAAGLWPQSRAPPLLV